VKRTIIIIALVAYGFTLKSQSELTLPMLPGVFQSSYLIPTVRPEHSMSLGLPGISSIYIQTIHNGFVPNSVVEVSDSIIIDPKKVPDEMSDQNMIFANADIDLFHLRLRIYNTNYWVGVRQKHSLALFYPKALFLLPVSGNADMVGETMNFGTLGLNSNFYREYTFGLSTELNKWAFGGRISLLQGLSCFYLKPQQIQVTIDEDDYTHSFAVDGSLYTAGVPFTSDKMINFDLFSNMDWILSYMTRFRNPGASLAFGMSYMLDQRTTFSLSFSDIGFIHWSDSTLNYRVKGEAAFKGLDILGDYLNGKEIELDSTINAFMDNFSGEEFEETFVTWLPPKFYLSANYQLARRTHLGLQMYSIINRKLYPAFSVGISQGIGRAFNIVLTGSFNQRTMTNLGLGLMIKPGSTQFYVLADNYYTPLVDPLTFTNLNFRFGMNLVFGRVKSPQGLPYR